MKVKTKAIRVREKGEHGLDPQKLQFLSFYTNPNSETFGNRMASALKAKYAQKYAKSICAKGNKWIDNYLSEFGGDLRRLHLSEKVFDEVLALDHIEDAIGAFGPVINKATGLPYKKVNTHIIKEKVKVSEFISETIGRNKYSKKIEVVGGFNNSELEDYD